jgi:hypothetical protein
MSATETIISFAVKKALDKAVGGPMPIVTSYHKTHFILLARAIQESNRDSDIQKTLAAIQKNLKDMKEYGAGLVKAIPSKPEPPSTDMEGLFLDADKNAEFSKQVEAFAAGVKNVLETLDNFLTLARDLTKRTAADLDKVEKNLNMNGAKWTAMRKISNAKRLEDIQFIKIDEVDKLSKQTGQAQSLFNAYDHI